MSKLKVLSIFGTRPCAIKMAPVLMELEKNKDQIESFVAVTGQHQEMLSQVLNIFGIKPNYDLKIMVQEQTLSYITQNILKKIDKVFDETKPDLVLVHGDTPTAFVSSLASFYRRIPIGHVEAGLRTFNKFNPFPEEINRVLIDRLVDLYFAPTSLSRMNLIKESAPKENIFVTGNTVIDAFLGIVKKNLPFESDFLKRIDFKKRIILITMHRRENLGESMEQVFKAVKEIASQNLDVEVVFPVHLNPKVKAPAERILGKEQRVHLLNPLPYQDMAKLIKNSYFILTDSGGLQEEAPSLGKPVLVLRQTTERPEGVLAGILKVVGVKKEKIVKEASSLLNNKETYERMSRAVNPYGDGQASVRIVRAILFKFGLRKEKVKEFEG